jgi:hypothetical protein
MNKIDKIKWDQTCRLMEDADIILENTLYSFNPEEWLIKKLVGDNIQHVTGHRWTHSSQYKGNHKRFEATYPKVRESSIDTLAPKWYSIKEIAVIRYTDITVDEWQAMKSFWYGIIGKDYDIPQIAGIAINAEGGHWNYPTALNNPNKFICSEACYRAAKYAKRNIDIEGVNKDNYAPFHFVELIKLGKARLIAHFIPQSYRDKIKEGGL